MNKGGESMQAALEMIELLAPFDATRPASKKPARDRGRARARKGRRR